MTEEKKFKGDTIVYINFVETDQMGNEKTIRFDANRVTFDALIDAFRESETEESIFYEGVFE